MSSNKSNRRTSQNNNNGKTTVVRQRLQRGAKDKVYAERLAAEKVIGTSSAVVAATTTASSGGEGGASEKLSGRRKSHFSASTNIDNNYNDDVDVANSHHQERHSEQTTTKGNRRSNRGSKQSSLQQQQQQEQPMIQHKRQNSSKKASSRERVTRIPIPPGWPFTSLNTATAATSTTTAGNSNGGKKRGRKRKSVGNDSAENDGNLKQLSGRKKDGHNNNNSSTLPPSSSSSSSSSTTLTSKKRQRGQKKHRAVAEEETPPMLEGPTPPPQQKTQRKQTKKEPKQKIEHQQKQSGSASTTSSSSTNSSKSKSSTTSSSSRRSRTKSKVNTTTFTNKNKWTCVRCTLLNTLRRKKCQVCGTPRSYTTNDNDHDDVVDYNDMSSILVDDTAAAAAGNVPGELMVTTTTSKKKGVENSNSGGKRTNEEKSNVNDDTVVVALLQGNDSSVLPSRSELANAANDLNDDDDVCNNVNQDGNLEYTTVNVSLTVSNTRVYDDDDDEAMSKSRGNDEKIKVTDTNVILSASVPASIYCREEEQTKVIHHDNSDAVESEETIDVALDTAVTNEATVETEEEEKCDLHHTESLQSQRSTQSELSALIDACPARSTLTTATNDLNDDDDDDGCNNVNQDGSLEYTTVNVSVTVSNTRVYDDNDAMPKSCHNDEKIKVTDTNVILSAIVPASIYGREEEQTKVIHHDNSDAVESEETSDVALDTAVTNEATFETEEEEECELHHAESLQSQRSIQSEFSALIDACPTSSSSVPPPTNNSPANSLDGILIHAKESAAVHKGLQEKGEEAIQQQQSFSQSSVQSEFSALIDATVLPRKQEQQQPQREKEEGELLSPLQIHQEQEQTQQSQNGRLGDNPDQFHINDDTADVLPTQQLQDEDEQQKQPPSDFKQWLLKRKDSRREKKRRRKRSNSTTGTDSQGQLCNESDGSDTDGSDGGNDYIETNSEVTTVVVRLIVRDRECVSNVLSAIVPISIFSQNGDAMEEVDIAFDENIDNAGNCNHPCNSRDVVVQQRENKADYPARLAHEDMGDAVEQSKFRLKESGDDVELDASESTAILSNRLSNKSEEDDDTQEGFLPGSTIGNTPICKTNEHCPSIQGSSSLHSHFPMTQQVPNFDYFTQASIEFSVQGEATSHCERDHGATLDYSNGVKESSSGNMKAKKQTMATKENNKISDKILGKENFSIHTHIDNSGIDDVKRQPLQHITTMQNDADCVENPNVNLFEEPDEYYIPPTSGLRFTSVGSGKMIAVNEEELAKAAKVVADNNTQKTDVHADDNEEEYEPYNPPTSGLGFTSVGSGKMIAVNEEELAKAAKVVADNNTQKTDVHADDNEEEYEPYNPPTSGLGFTSAGSGKMIAVNEEELAKAAKVVADNNAQKTDVHADDNEEEYEPYNPPTSGLGFTSVGSGKMIAVNEEELAKAAKVLADNNTQKTDAHADDNEEEYEPYNPPTSGLGFTIAGSGKMIAVNEEELAKAAKVLADNNTQKTDVHADDNEEEYEPYNPPTSGLGFTSAGSGKMIAVNEEELAKAAKVLADNNTQKTDVHADDNEEEYEPYNPPTSGLGFTSVGSGKMIAVNEEDLAKATKVLADNNTQKTDVHADDNEEEYEPYNPPTSGLGFTSVGSGKMIAVNEEELAKAAKVLADNNTQKTDVHADDNEEEYEPYNPPTSGLGFTSVGSGKMIAVNEEELAKAAKVVADNNTQKTDAHADDNEEEYEPYNPPTSGLGFTSVGSGKMFSFDEKELAKAATVLADDDQKYNINDDDSVVISHVKNLFDDDDNRAGKNTQKVRFSLGGNTSIRPEVSSDTFTEDNLSSSMLTRVSVDGMIQSPFTPANTNVSHERLPVGDFESKAGVACESKDYVNIVTGNEEKSAVIRLLEGESDQSSSPYNSNANACTPLNVVNRLDSFQSEIKSKRLFERTISSEKAARINLNDDSPSAGADISGSTKVTLRQLAKRCNMETEWDKSKDAGVSDVVLKLTSVNALKLRFSEEGLPSFFFGQRAAPGRNHGGSVDDIYKWLVDEEFDESLFTKKWVQNHYRWIVWKLGSMERRFPSQLSGRYLTYQHVLLQMKSRYEKELCNAKRPSVRKILNRDVSASVPIVLCVAQILRCRSKGTDLVSGKSTNAEEIRLELTDGWYGVPAVIDTILQSLVANEKIHVGSKLLICNAQLSGSDEGVDPLDEGYSSEKRTCPVFLKITTNNTRLATWDAKLGFLSPKSSGITIKSLRDIYPGGGNIPSIDLVVCKRYPKMFLEQISTGEKQIPTTTHLTEGEEASRRSVYDLKQQRAGEKHVEAAHSECTKELDEDAPFEWKQLALSNSPEEYYEKLSSFEKKVVDDWNERRPVLLQSMMSKFIGDSLRDESVPVRKSNPYVKTLVKIFHRDHTKVSTQASAELTVWRVSDEQFDLLKEGAVLRMKNLGVKEKNRDGFLQLRAGPETVMEPLLDESKRQLARSGYEERRPKSIIKINLMSKKMETGRLSNEVDVVACVARIQQLDEYSTAIYLTDETGLTLKLTRNHSAENTDPFQLGNAKAHQVVSFCNIQISAFDEIEQCATGTWGLFSCKANRINSRHKELDSWRRSQCGADAIDFVCARLEAGIPIVGGLSNRHQISIGYILAIFGEGGCADAQRIKAAIDYGETRPLIAEFPLHLIQHTLALLQWKGLREHSQVADLSDITSLNTYFLSNQKLLHFSFEVVSCYGGDSPTLRIMQVSRANVDALTRLLMTSKSK